MPRAKHEPDPAARLPAELNCDRPKGDQLRRILEEFAFSLGPGTLLPSERVLAERFGIARMTVRQEIDRLVADGLVFRRPGHGTFTAETKPAQVGGHTSFSRDMRARGMTPGARVLRCAVEHAASTLAERLEVPAGSPVLRLIRLRTANGVPMALERTNVSMLRFPGIEDVDWSTHSLYEELERRWGVRVRSVTATISVLTPEPTDADLLGIPLTQPCFLIRGLPRSASGTVIEAGRSIYRGDRYDVITEVRRTEAPEADTEP